MMLAVRPDLPTGTVTFLFTDIEGSTKLLHELGPEAYAEALAEHRRIIRQAFGAQGGVEVDTQGDAFFVAFPTATGALAAAIAARDELSHGPIKVRAALHTGSPHLAAEGYVGVDVHRAARIGSAGHGGQILVSAATVAAVGADGLRALGEHRLKDFDAPLPIYQVGEERFPPLKTISNTNLPRPASSFVGRQAEVAAVAALLTDGARLLSLTGPGGSGKTRLALEAAASLVTEFKAGVFWVALAALRDPALVGETIGQSLGAKEGLAEHIGERQMLLLLDNLEQVVAAAPQLADLLEACPQLRLLVTSRERLRVRGEVEYPVAPLAEPEAVELFCARAGVEPNSTVDQLCRALDNLPLAIELAAARVSILSPAQILERVSERLDLLKGGRDADARQLTLRATIEWSHALLSPEDQALFGRLAVFAGGCTLAAAEAVAEAELDTLQSLVDKSLLRHGEDRFSMLETIREFATERLEASGQADQLRRRHADFFLALAEEAYPNTLGVSPNQWLDRLESDNDNLRAAGDWLRASGKSQFALRMAGTLWEFWCLRNHAKEGWRRLEEVLAADDQPTMARAMALTGSTHLAANVGEMAARRLRSEQALALHRQLGDAWGIAYAEFQYAASFCDTGDFAIAQPLLEESVRRLGEVADEHRELQARRYLAWASKELGDVDRYRSIYEENLRRARVLGDTENQQWALESLSSVATEEGRHGEALVMLGDAYSLARDSGDPEAIDMNLVRLGNALAFAGRSDIAVRVLALADAMHEDLGWSYEGWFAEIRERAVARAQAELGDSAFNEAWEAGRKMTADEAAALGMRALKAPS
jgi:predicted ATPase/class 3 adenylate cyclase